MIDGHIYNGRTGSATEGGHVTIDLARAEMRMRQAWMHRSAGVGSRNCSCVRVRKSTRTGTRGARAAGISWAGDVEKIQSEQVAAAWRAGDPLAKEILAETMDYLTVWLGNIIDLLEPEVIVIGGGIGELASEWFGYIRAKLPAWIIIKRGAEIPIVLARYVADSGIAGAAALCLASQQR